jgi:transposase
MPLPSRRSKNTKAIPRKNGAFVARGSQRLDNIPTEHGATTAVDVVSADKTDQHGKQLESDQHVLGSAGDLDDHAGLIYFDDWWTHMQSNDNTDKISIGINKRRAVYTGDGDRTVRRKRAEIYQALRSCPMAPITSYFAPDRSPQECVSSEIDNPFMAASETASQCLSLTECVAALEALYDKAVTLKGPRFVQISVLLKFFELRDIGWSRRRAAAAAAEGMPSKLTRHGRTIQFWARHFESCGAVPITNQGQHQKTVSLLHDEDFLVKCREWLKLQPPNQRCPQRFQQYLNHDVLPLLTGAVQATVSESTARRWMIKVGYKYGIWKKGVYMDGHERLDVVAYRTKFCATFLGLTDQMRFYCGDDMQTVEAPSSDVASEVVWVTHDESIFYANDDGGKGWHDEKSPDLQKKGRGRSIMVSDFLCPCHGRLFNMVDGVKIYTTQVLEVGKNHEGFWTSEHVVRQVGDAVVLAFAAMHPGATGLFTFDQSTNHAAFAADALRATSMGMKPGGKQAILRPGMLSDGTEQSMVFEPGHELAGQAKGLKEVLMERGIDITALNMKLMCKDKNIDVYQGGVLMCCARHCMASHRDFLSQVSILEETITNTGHICLFLPKYHCELNPIEAYWGAAKRFARANCDYSFDGLKACVPKSLESVSLVSIRKFFRRCAHFIELYSMGCDYELSKYAHKKYKSHRRIPQSILQERESIMVEMQKP